MGNQRRSSRKLKGDSSVTTRAGRGGGRNRRKHERWYLCLSDDSSGSEIMSFVDAGLIRDGDQVKTIRSRMNHAQLNIRDHASWRDRKSLYPLEIVFSKPEVAAGTSTSNKRKQRNERKQLNKRLKKEVVGAGKNATPEIILISSDEESDMNDSAGDAKANNSNNNNNSNTNTGHSAAAEAERVHHHYCCHSFFQQSPIQQPQAPVARDGSILCRRFIQKTGSIRFGDPVLSNPFASIAGR